MFDLMIIYLKTN